VAWGGYLLWERRWKALFGFSLFVALVGIVCLGMEWAAVYRTGGTRLVEKVIHMQVTGRLGEKSNHPFFYYGLCLLEMGGLWWILIAAAALRQKQGTRSADPGPPSIREWVRGHAPIRQAGAWVIGILAVFTLASTKKARYILPLYPALAVLLGSWIVRLQEGRRLPASPRWEKSLLVITAGLVLLSVVFCLFFPQWVFVPHWALLLWMAAAAAGGWGISKRLTSRWQPVGAVLLLLFTALVGVNLLVTPALSRRASGRAFVQAAEARVDPRLPVVLYGIGRDGDGVKYALHSSRRPSSLRFVNNADALATMTPPFLFVMEARGQGGLPAPLASKRCHLVAKGHLRSHHLVAYRVDRQGPPMDAQKKEIR
jgi:4-amino-4-deoxy-L-arabinose transferase-like glycosyltransferase